MANDPKRLETKSGDAVGYNFAFSYDLGSGRSVQVTGVLPVGATNEAINAEWDKLRTSLDRQQAKTAIYGIEAELEKIDGTLTSLMESLAEAEERFAGKKLPSNEEAAHNNIKVSIRDLSGKRARVAELLERTRKEAE